MLEDLYHLVVGTLVGGLCSAILILMESFVHHLLEKLK